HLLAAELIFLRLICCLGRDYYLLLLHLGLRFGESSATAAARQPGSSVARRVNYSFVDTVEASVRAFERRTMAAIEMVNLRVSYQADVRKRQSKEFHSRHQDAQEDRAAVRAEIKVLR
ncbi:hypothetical protein Tco_0504092, partial [Tanacetum coccineum]